MEFSAFLFCSVEVAVTSYRNMFCFSEKYTSIYTTEGDEQEFVWRVPYYTVDQILEVRSTADSERQNVVSAHRGG